MTIDTNHFLSIEHPVHRNHFLNRSSGARSLLVVIEWEFRRRLMNRFQWVLLLAIVVLLGTLLISSPYRGLLGNNILVPSSSPLGSMLEIPGFLLFLFLLFLPFMIVDLVANDYTRRVHEVLMATPIPTKAYLWGRYVVGLSICTVLAVIMLVGVILADFQRYVQLRLYPGLLSTSVPVIHAPGYPGPDVAFLIMIWLVAVIPAILFLSGLCFMLGTLLPRRSNTIKAILLVTWVLCFSLAPQMLKGMFTLADPTSASIADLVWSQAIARFQSQAVGVDFIQRLRIARQIEFMKPEMLPWAIAQGLYAILGIVLVISTTYLFRRFQNLFN